MTGAGLLVEVSNLSKSFKNVQAVKNLSFAAQPGRVTGFLGPNGSGKTTTLQMLLGLVRQDSGSATIAGKTYFELERPALTVGSSIAPVFHPAHTGRAHLEIMSRAIGAPAGKVDELLNLTGIESAADRKIGGYSLGMRQRLALAQALLGDPQVIVLDEPINGLDPEGIRWIRMFLKHLAQQGKTVLLSSHMLGEVQQTVDDAVIIRGGELVYAGELAGLQQQTKSAEVFVAAADNAHFFEVLRGAGFAVQNASETGEMLLVANTSTAAVGQVAQGAGVALTHLSAAQIDLEESFLQLIDSFERPQKPGRHATSEGGAA